MGPAVDYRDASHRKGEQPPGASPPPRHQVKLAEALPGRPHTRKQNDASVEARVGKRASQHVRVAENRDQPELLEC